ncbi:hypothetical protein JXA80_08595 [bacterium]|nr:hypothetical protein [candidate division CSSED10-310 bacterium]
MNTDHTAASARSPIHTETFPVLSHDVDVTGFLRIDALLGLLHETAWRHAERSGCGFKHLQQFNLLWVISRFSMRILHRPSRGETVLIRTWPRQINRLFAYRDFEIRDHHDDTLCVATGMWIIIDHTSRKPVNMLSFKDFFGLHNQTVLDNHIAKLRIPDTRDYCYYHTVSWLDLDFNDHVNNLNYLRWVIRAIPDPILMKYTIVGMQIDHTGECHTGDPIAAAITLDQSVPSPVCYGRVFRKDTVKEFAHVALTLQPIVS